MLGAVVLPPFTPVTPASFARAAGLALLGVVVACSRASSPSASPDPAAAPVPFDVRDDSANLVMTFADASGFHSVERVADVPVASRGTVRVEPVVGTEPRPLDAAHVWVADLREAGADGTYPVRVETRDGFESRARPPTPSARPASPNPGAPPDDPSAGGAPRDPSVAAQAPVDPATGIVLYGTSWCGVCRTAREFFRSRGVAFVERDIERDPGAREEMLRKARAQGIEPRGVPVIDVYGRIFPGFDQARIGALLTGI